MVLGAIIAIAITYVVPPIANGNLLTLSEAGGQIILEDTLPAPFCVTIQNQDTRRAEIIVERITRPPLVIPTPNGPITQPNTLSKQVAQLAPSASLSIRRSGAGWQITPSCD